MLLRGGGLRGHCAQNPEIAWRHYKMNTYAFIIHFFLFWTSLKNSLFFASLCDLLVPLQQFSVKAVCLRRHVSMSVDFWCHNWEMLVGRGQDAANILQYTGHPPYWVFFQVEKSCCKFSTSWSEYLTKSSIQNMIKCCWGELYCDTCGKCLLTQLMQFLSWAFAVCELLVV